jgi:hypothetical protein
MMAVIVDISPEWKQAHVVGPLLSSGTSAGKPRWSIMGTLVS